MFVDTVMQKPNSLFKAIVAVVVIGVVSLGVLIYLGLKNDEDGSVAGSSNANNQVASDSVPSPSGQDVTAQIAQTSQATKETSGSVYKDGTYSAQGNYNSPGGPESINVTLTIKNDIVTGAGVTAMAKDRTSQRYQGYFISGYKQYVIGKNISTISLDKVSGSSLTPAGFNMAIQKIEVQAKA
ncbi:MAG: calcium-binding protein [Candidatus Pacebacteria bacterium]|nr:calcium-binding protein [Candidatus Paceibacterota bacterium]